MTFISLSASQLSPGVRFYAVVQAYNSAGLHTTETSDGFIVDVEPPLTGIVLDGKGTNYMGLIMRKYVLLFSN